MTGVRVLDTIDISPGDVECGSPRGIGVPCNLPDDHDGDHAEVSYSGLVVNTWPRQRMYDEYGFVVHA